MDFGPEPLAQFSQQFKEMVAIGVITEDGLPLVAAGADVIAAAGPLDSQCACHARD